MGTFPALLPDLARYPVVALDTETTGVAHDSVPVGVSFALPDGQKGYNAWGQGGGGNNCTLATVRAWLQDLGPETVVVMHNALFDLRMLKNIGVDLIAQGVTVHDTGFMAAVYYELEPSFSLGALAQRRLGVAGKSDEALNQFCADNFGGAPTRNAQAKNYWRVPLSVIYEYAVDDAVLTLNLWHWYNEQYTAVPDQKNVLDLEHSLIPTLYRMNQVGVRVDVDRAAQHAARIESELAILSQQWDALTGGVPISGPGSRTGLTKLWLDAGLPHARTKKGAISITKEHVALAGGQLAETLKGVRLRDKVLGTFLKGYIIDGHHHGRIHSTFHPLRTDDFGAVSGRFSSSDPNLQNLPSPDKDDPTAHINDRYGYMIRSLVLPEAGAQWVKLDYSQIEYRFFAHYAGGQIQQAYLNDPDVDFHQFCADVAGVPRSTAKNGNFAKLYGAGPGRLASTLGVSVDEARRFMTEYDAKIPEAADLYQTAMDRAARRGYIITWGGRKRHFRRRGNRFDKTYAALNALLQGSSADLTKRAMVAIDRELLDWTNTIMHITVHDEVDFSAPLGAAGDTFIKRAKEIMEHFDLSVPIRADAEHGPTWGDIYEYDGRSTGRAAA